MTDYDAFPDQYYPLFQEEDNIVLLESSLNDQHNRYSYLFTRPVRVLCIRRASELPALLQEIQRWVDDGYYLAGYIGYASGEALLPADPPQITPSAPPLAWFGVYRQPTIFDHLTGQLTLAPDLAPRVPSVDTRGAAEPYQIANLQFDLSPAEYMQRVATIQDYIRAGDVYQINFTGRYTFDFAGSPITLYQTLKQHQPVRYGALIQAAGHTMLSCSPELFFRVDGWRIQTRPMKGTAPRGRTLAEDAAQMDWLRHDEKNRAENLMIVDLLRNDLGRISAIGSVRVPALYTIERYPTLFQMTSTVEATLEAEVRYDQLFASLFPCGSVTGAPKIRAMEIIHELETTPRHIYTGAIGFFAPRRVAPDHGHQIMFNVAIRTIVLSDGKGELGIGSGIVADSVPQAEYAECAVKARFVTESPVTFAILESLLWQDGFHHREKHLQRMQQSAAYFDYRYQQHAVDQCLAAAAAQCAPGCSYKVRVCLSRNGALEYEVHAIADQDASAPVRVVLSAVATNSHDRFIFHKTTNRALYQRASRWAMDHGFADMLFFNERGELTEGATTNIFLDHAGQLTTPAQSCGLLNGVYRQHVLETQAGAREGLLSLEDLLQADAIYICNAIRGWRRATLIPRRMTV